MFEQNKEDMEEMKAMMEKVKTAYEALPEDMKTQVDAIKEEYKVDFR
jgi:cytochrome c556